MKAKRTDKMKMVKVPENVLLSLVAEKLRGKDLFPEKTKSAKDFFDKIKSSAL
jgi:hypothetical protein